MLFDVVEAVPGRRTRWRNRVYHVGQTAPSSESRQVERDDLLDMLRIEAIPISKVVGLMGLIEWNM